MRFQLLWTYTWVYIHNSVLEFIFSELIHLWVNLMEFVVVCLVLSSSIDWLVPHFSVFWLCQYDWYWWNIKIHSAVSFWNKNYSRSQVTSCGNLWLMSVKVNKYLCDSSVITTQIIILQIRTITNRTELTQYLFLSCQKFWLVSGTCHKLVRWGQSACVTAVWLINHSVMYCIYKAVP